MKKIYLIIVLSFLILSCKSIASSKELAEAYYSLGNAYTELKKSTEAEKAYKKALYYNKNLNIAGYNLVLMYITSEDYDKALNLSIKLLEKDPDNSFYLKLYAYSLYKNEDKEKALVQYGKVLEKLPLDNEALYNSGIILFELEDYEKSVLYFNKLKDMDPVYERTHYYLAEIDVKNEKLDKAEEYLNLFLETKQKDVRALTLLTDVYTQKNEYGKLIETYDLLIPVSKENKGELLLKKAEIVYTVVQDEEASFESLKKAVEAQYKEKEDYLAFAENIKVLDEKYFNRIKDLLIEKGIIEKGDI